MSWGEKSCKNKPCPIPDKCNMLTCNVDCEKYEWDGKTKPDSRPLIELETLIFQIKKEVK
jgi:hypothetical protein